MHTPRKLPIVHASPAAGVLKFTRKPEEHKSQERALFSEKEQTAGDMRATIQFEAPGLVRWSRCDNFNVFKG